MFFLTCSNIFDNFAKKIVFFFEKVKKTTVYKIETIFLR